MKTAKMCFTKHASTLDVTLVTKDRPRRYKKGIFVLKTRSCKLSESFNSIAEGVLEIFEEVYLGGGGCALFGIGLNHRWKSFRELLRCCSMKSAKTMQ